MKSDAILQHTEVLRRTASALRESGYLSTQCLPSLKRPFWKVFLELHRLIRLPERMGNCFTPTAMPGFLANRFLKGKQNLKTAHSMFFLNRSVPRKFGEELLGASLLEDLVASGLVLESENGVRSSVRFVPWHDYLILSDPDEGAERGTDFYVYVGGDSTLLTDFVNRRLEEGFKADRGLDLCAGTSIQSYNLLQRCSEITAAELNPRAVSYARASREVNGAERITVVQSDLWENVNGSFGMIVSNPPYLPMPGESISVKTLDVCGGGELGLDIPLGIIDGLGTHLEQGGYSAVLAASPIIGGRDILHEDLLPIAEKHGLEVKLHAWKYTNLKLDMGLQKRKGISHFIFCVIESRKTGTPSVTTVHQPFYKRLPQRFSSWVQLLFFRLSSPGN